MNKKSKIFDRRNFLKSSFAFCFGSLALPSVLAAKTKKTQNKTLKLFNINTREHLTVTYYKDGAYVKSALDKIDHIMADKRSKQIMKTDLVLIDTLHKIQTRSNAKEPITLICGYRAPATNSKLVKSKKGVAKGSYHTRGQAADIKIPGVELSDIKKIAESLKKGGVGYYPNSGFVHVDVGPTRTWRG